MPGRHRRKETAVEANGDLMLITRLSGGKQLGVLQCTGEVGAGLAKRAPLPGIGRGFLVGRCRIVETLSLFVVVRHQRPFRGTVCRCGDEGVCYSTMQSVPKTWRRELRGHLAEKLMLETPAVFANGPEHPATPELLEHVIDLALAHLDHG